MTDNTIAFGAIACIIGVITFFFGRMTAAKTDGEWKGRLDTNMEYIKDGMQKLEVTVSASLKVVDNNLDRARNEAKEGIAGVHTRLDAHLNNDHGMPVPQRGRAL